MTPKGFQSRSKLVLSLLQLEISGKDETDLIGNSNFVYAVLRNKKRFEGKKPSFSSFSG
jgi:hypothetical protein